MIPLELAKELHAVPESIVREYADHFGVVEGKKNSFMKLLDAAAIFRIAGTKPIFLSTKDGMGYAVSSEATFMKKLH
jgi:hypothetical protein